MGNLSGKKKALSCREGGAASSIGCPEKEDKCQRSGARKRSPAGTTHSEKELRMALCANRSQASCFRASPNHVFLAKQDRAGLRPRGQDLFQ